MKGTAAFVSFFMLTIGYRSALVSSGNVKVMTLAGQNYYLNTDQACRIKQRGVLVLCELFKGTLLLPVLETAEKY